MRRPPTSPVRWLGRLVPAFVLVVAACDAPPQEAGIAAPPTLETAAAVVPAGVLYGCPPLPSVTERWVTPGVDHDLNGNGRVCDESIGPALPSFTTDDVIVADPALDGAGS